MVGGSGDGRIRTDTPEAKGLLSFPVRNVSSFLLLHSFLPFYIFLLKTFTVDDRQHAKIKCNQIYFLFKKLKTKKQKKKRTKTKTKTRKNIPKSVQVMFGMVGRWAGNAVSVVKRQSTRTEWEKDKPELLLGTSGQSPLSIISFPFCSFYFLQGSTTRTGKKKE